MVFKPFKGIPEATFGFVHSRVEYIMILIYSFKKHYFLEIVRELLSTAVVITHPYILIFF